LSGFVIPGGLGPGSNLLLSQVGRVGLNRERAGPLVRRNGGNAQLHNLPGTNDLRIAFPSARSRAKCDGPLKCALTEKSVELLGYGVTHVERTVSEKLFPRQLPTIMGNHANKRRDRRAVVSVQDRCGPTRAAIRFDRRCESFVGEALACAVYLEVTDHGCEGTGRLSLRFRWGLDRLDELSLNVG
jgi:hypothetical protein